MPLPKADGPQAAVPLDPQQVRDGMVRVRLHEPRVSWGSSVWLDGQLMTGFSTSLTVTVNEHDVLFPLVSVTSKVLVVVPTGKVEPLGIPAFCAVVAPGQLSEPTGVV